MKGRMIKMAVLYESTLGFDTENSIEVPAADIHSVSNLGEELVVYFYSGHVISTPETDREYELLAIAQQNAKERTEYR